MTTKVRCPICNRMRDTDNFQGNLCRDCFCETWADLIEEYGYPNGVKNGRSID